MTLLLPSDLHWPIMVYSGQAYFDWAAHQDQVDSTHLMAGDQLFDSQGRCYQLQFSSAGENTWQQVCEPISLTALNQSLKEYAASIGVCCVAKLTVHTVADAIALVAWLEEQ